MGYRTGLEIKKTILEQLADRPYVLSELERRVDTNGRVLRRHLEELVTLGLVRLQQHPCHARNGQSYTTAALNPVLPQHSFESAMQNHVTHSKPSDGDDDGIDARVSETEDSQ